MGSVSYSPGNASAVPGGASYIVRGTSCAMRGAPYNFRLLSERISRSGVPCPTGRRTAGTAFSCKEKTCRPPVPPRGWLGRAYSITRRANGTARKNLERAAKGCWNVRFRAGSVKEGISPPPPPLVGIFCRDLGGKPGAYIG